MDKALFIRRVDYFMVSVYVCLGIFMDTEVFKLPK